MPPPIMRRHLIELSVENWLRIGAAYVKFNETGVIEITGDNEDGKTSLLTAIIALIGGKAMMPPDPIHGEAPSFRLRGRVGELLITRTGTRKPDGSFSDTVKVEDADGGVYPSPQALLNDLVSTLTYDPLEFTNLKERERYEILRGFVEGVDWEKDTRLHKRDIEIRRDANRDAEALKARYEGIAYPGDTPKTRIDASRVLKELEEGGRFNEARERVVAQADRLKGRITDAEKEIARLQAQVTEDNRLLESLEVVDAKDLTALRKTVEDAATRNANVDRRKTREDLEALYALEMAKVAAAQKSMDDRLALQRKAIEAAKMPVDGLTLIDGAVYYKGHPFEQASGMVQLRTAVMIAVNKDPQFRAIIVKEGGLMGPKALAMLEEMAIEHDFLIIIERVDVSGKVGIVMEQGRIVSTPESRAAGVPPTDIDPLAAPKKKDKPAKIGSK